MNLGSNQDSDFAETGENTHKVFEDEMHRFTELNRDKLFDPAAGYKFSNKLVEAEQDPFIGFVGKSYFDANVRVCFLGKANAETKNQEYDLKINKALISFKTANQKQRSNRYSEYRDLYQNIIPTWQIYRYPARFLELLDWNLSAISYANIVPFRYIGKPPQDIYKTSFEYFTGPFLKAVAPDFIVPLGQDLQYTVRRYYTEKKCILKGIPRTNGDSYTTPEAENCIQSVVQKVREHMDQNGHC